jgi:uncharacterized protein YceK
VRWLLAPRFRLQYAAGRWARRRWATYAMAKLLGLGLSLVVLVMVGCATVESFSTDWDSEPCEHTPTLSWTYSGSQLDIEQGSSSAFALFFFIDLPLSFFADTLVLPYTIPKQIGSGNLSDSCPGITPSWSG